MPAANNRDPTFLYWAVATTLLVEAVTIVLRFGVGTDAVAFNKAAPLVLQIHHMFWSVPVLLVLPFVRRRRKLTAALAGVALGLILSDLLHHFVVLPLTVGNTGWHWP